MTVTISMTTAPRQKPVIDKTIFSLRAGGFTEPVHLWAEPDSIIPSKAILHQNATKYGQFKNFKQQIGWLVENTASDYYYLLQDDFVTTRQARAKLDTWVANCNQFGFISLYTAYYHRKLIKNARIDFTSIRSPLECIWGCTIFIVLPRYSLEWIWAHDDFQGYTKRQNTDCLLTQMFTKANKKVYIASKSLVDHRGYHSTIGHVHSEWNKGLRFSG